MRAIKAKKLGIREEMSQVFYEIKALSLLKEIIPPINKKKKAMNEFWKHILSLDVFYILVYIIFALIVVTLMFEVF